MVQFVSRDELPLMTGGDYLPLCDKTWIRAHRDSKLRTLSTLAFMTSGFTWDHVDRFHQVVLNSILWNLDAQDDLDRDRLKMRENQDNRRVDTALADLADILRQGEKQEFRRISDDEDVLVTACKIVGRAIVTLVLKVSRQALRDLQVHIPDLTLVVFFLLERILEQLPGMRRFLRIPPANLI